ncbi:RNA polymerase binding protein [Vibrio phage YC]|uniref:RNA polymerase binding protein n=1 Tax=Vibrio phage YC TaxID=2267403 RepID=A0A384ZS14_9CAUD|nr:baseplate tail tube cap [Vibrio phage YC]AXC34441.1 RNA polymerase binding protein [Vibrio phage YC]
MAALTSTQAKYALLNQDANRGKGSVRQLVYPSDLLNAKMGHGHFFLIDFNEIVGTSFRSQANDGEAIVSGFDQPVVYQRDSGSLRKHSRMRHRRSGESIALMMPEGVQTNYGANWENIELGSAGQFLRTATNLDNLSLADVKNYALEQLKGATTGAIQAITPINAADAAELFTGTISNPYVEVLFKGVTNREFPMSFTFKPKSRDEADTIKEIARRLKFHMHPEYKYRETESAYMLHPSTVDLTFMKISEEGIAERNTWLWRMSTCGITNVALDVSGPDGYTPHKDDAPAIMKLDISFIELEPLHKGRFNDPEENF